MLKRYKKPYPSIGDIVDAAGYDFDYVDYRVPFKLKDFEKCTPEEEYDVTEFFGCLKTKSGELIPLDGDCYERSETVIASEEWSLPEEGINHGLTIVMNSEFVSGEEIDKMLDEWKKEHEKETE